MKSARLVLLAVFVTVIASSTAAIAQDRGTEAEKNKEAVFSGPQPGEKLVPFTIKGVFGADADQDIDLVTKAGNKPLAIIFVHEVTRPSIGLTRMIMDYAAKLGNKGLVSGVVFLDDDATAAVSRLQRARHALPANVPIGLSVDGREGPGAYGLNRNVSLTILVAKDQRVRANFALVQPGVQADAERIARAIAESVEVKAPTLAELDTRQGEMTARRAEPQRGDGKLEELLRAVIRKSNDANAVKEAVAAVESHLAENPASKVRLGEIATTIVNAGKLENYGTPDAQKVIQRWAEEARTAKKKAASDTDKTDTDKTDNDKTDNDKTDNDKTDTDKADSNRS